MDDYTDDQLKADLKRLVKLKGFAPLTPEQAEAELRELDEDVAAGRIVLEPLSEERIREIVDYATGKGPFPGKDRP